MTCTPTSWCSRLFALGVLLLGLIAMFGSRPADAHALVNSTFPVDGQVLDVAPAEVSLTFNEGVEAPTAAVRVYDGEGERVDNADADVDPQDPTRIRTSLQPGLPDGTYVVTWRAVSADGHPIKGAWLFSVGEPNEVGEDLVAALFSADGDRPLAIAAVVVRALTLLGTLLVAGIGLFTLFVRHAPSERPALVALLRRGMNVAFIGTLLGVPVQAMLETGLGLGALSGQPITDVMSSPVGISAGARLLLLAATAALLRNVVPPAAAWTAVGAGLTFVLEGHTLTQDPIALIFAADVVHLLAASAWGGGLVALLVLVRARRRGDDPVGAAELVASFSRMATVSLIAVAVAGSAMAWVTVRAARALTSTGYGWTLVVKLGLVAVLVVLGTYNNRRLVPAVVRAGALAGAATDVQDDADLQRRIGDGAWIRLRDTVRLEVIAMAAVVAVTAVLVGQQPASQEAGITGAFTTYEQLGEDFEVNLVVDPNRAGLNQLHVYVLDQGGRPVEAEDVTFLLEHPELELGPFERVGSVSGPGHWTLTGRELAVAGRWEITVQVRLSRFEQERVTIPVVVNP